MGGIADMDAGESRDTQQPLSEDDILKRLLGTPPRPKSREKPGNQQKGAA